jgi:hypothetical protein
MNNLNKYKLKILLTKEKFIIFEIKKIKYIHTYTHIYICLYIYIYILQLYLCLYLLNNEYNI